jgi:hypothetical protein
MSEVDNQVDTAEVEDVQGVDIGQFIDAIAAQNFNQAKSHFDDLLADRMNDALEQEKITVANNIYNGVEDDIDDEDLEFDEPEDEEPEVEDEEESS